VFAAEHGGNANGVPIGGRNYASVVVESRHHDSERGRVDVGLIGQGDKDSVEGVGFERPVAAGLVIEKRMQSRGER